jgi:hypothetical protein
MSLTKPNIILGTLLLAWFAVWGWGQSTSIPTTRRVPKKVQYISSLPPEENRWAVVVGIGKYSNKGFRPVSGDRDARAFAQALKDYGRFPTDQVKLLVTGKNSSGEPTRNNIINTMSDIAELITSQNGDSDNLWVFFFSGHGSSVGGNDFLLPIEISPKSDETYLKSQAVSVDEIKEWLRKAGVKQALIFLDSCRDDPFVNPGKGDGQNRLKKSLVKRFSFAEANDHVKAHATFFASEPGKRAWVYEQKGMGYFTYELVRGLSGAAADKEGKVTLSALVEHVQKEVPKLIKRVDEDKSRFQMPIKEGDGYLDNKLVLAVVEPTPTELHGGGTKDHEVVPASADPSDLVVKSETIQITDGASPETSDALPDSAAVMFQSLGPDMQQVYPMSSEARFRVQQHRMAIQDAQTSLAFAKVHSTSHQAVRAVFDMTLRVSFTFRTAGIDLKPVYSNKVDLYGATFDPTQLPLGKAFWDPKFKDTDFVEIADRFVELLQENRKKKGGLHEADVQYYRKNLAGLRDLTTTTYQKASSYPFAWEYQQFQGIPGVLEGPEVQKILGWGVGDDGLSRMAAWLNFLSSQLDQIENNPLYLSLRHAD